MTNTKKVFAELVAFLEENKTKKVSTIMPDILEMTAKLKNSGSGIGKNSLKDEEGNVIAVYCYYHKTWELVEHIPYGVKKSNTSTGLNTMCKIGVSQWTKQQRAYVKAKDSLLNEQLAGNISLEEARERIAVLDEEIKAIVPHNEFNAKYTSNDVNELTA